MDCAARNDRGICPSRPEKLIAILPAFLSGAALALLCVATQSATAQEQTAARFDVEVRGEMFSGMAGDQEALDRAMNLCEQELERNPKSPEAMVWHGSGLVFQAGQMFRTGDFANGKAKMVRGLREMDDAVALAPDSVAVLIPRGASLLAYAAHSSDP